ncbi:hypothetical protein G6M89_21390 [Natronolimnobius sp. AArcel1]|uniref:hypothetical protein n=1 Tax=Natronolimnobius sp. AArcel1 TaxID=1679093 RepID=UPI0013EA5FA6|nr:hypothetical protein [Natronolimnobius sp. AArcel1]NGM71505.1 hypothetical protein [Natronolimnobius sp. AArcel1]
MLEWFGGVSNVISLAIPLFGLALLVALSKITETNRSQQYIIPAFCCWAGFHLVIALREGTLVAVPRLVGASLATVLLIGFIVLFFRGLFELWQLRDTVSMRP